MNYGLGCIKSVLDGTEFKYSFGHTLPLPEEFSYISTMPPVLDQGNTSKCVCYSITSVLDWQVNKFKSTNKSNGFGIDELYNIRADKTAAGMQIKEALKFIRHTGLDGQKIKLYSMVDSVDLLKYSLVFDGPCVAGLPVYRENINDRFWKGNTFTGGHCITIIGFDRDGFIIRNSWGKDWCDHGHVVLPYSDFDSFFEIWNFNQTDLNGGN